MHKDNSNWSMTGGIAAAMGASLCCAGPLVLLSLGVSGAWIANLTALEPFRPFFIAVVIGLFGLAGWQLFKPLSYCEPGTACAHPGHRRTG